MKLMVSRVARHRKALTPIPVWAPAARAAGRLPEPNTSPTVGPKGRSAEQALSSAPEAIRARVAPRTSTIETSPFGRDVRRTGSTDALAEPKRAGAEATLYNTAKRGDDKAKTQPAAVRRHNLAAAGP